MLSPAWLRRVWASVGKSASASGERVRRAALIENLESRTLLSGLGEVETAIVSELSAPVAAAVANVSYNANSANLSNVPFIMAKPGTAKRIFRGTGTFVGQSFTNSFTLDQIQGVNCLKWRQFGDGEDNFIMWLAKDSAGTLRVLKYIEGSEVAYRASSPAVAVRAMDCQSLRVRVYGRLAAGKYAAGSVFTQENVTVRVLATEATLAQFPGASMVKLKTVRTEGSFVDVDYTYLNRACGITLLTWNDGGAKNGWKLTNPPLFTASAAMAAPTYNSNSANLSNVPFIMAKPGTAKRVFKGTGSFAGSSYVESFLLENLLGVNCLKWRHAGDIVDSWVMWLAKDTSGTLRVFKYVDDGEVIYRAKSAATAVRAADLENTLAGIIGELAAGGYRVGTMSSSPDMVVKLLDTNFTLPQYPEYPCLKIKAITEGDDVDYIYMSPVLGVLVQTWNDSGLKNGWKLVLPAGA